MRLTGTGRVTVTRLTYQWPDRRCVLAYTTTGTLGETAVVATVPVPGRPGTDPDLWAVATAHLDPGPFGPSIQSAARWLLTTALGARLTTSPHSFDAHAATWHADIVASFDLTEPHAGHLHGHVGRLSFADQSLNERAWGLVD
nr:hypothetical protein [Streptomyces sp. SID5468]